MVTRAPVDRLVADLANVDQLQQALADRLRKVLLALILARETEALLLRRIDVLRGHATDRLRSARAAELAAQWFRDILSALPNDDDSFATGGETTPTFHRDGR